MMLLIFMTIVGLVVAKSSPERPLNLTRTNPTASDNDDDPTFPGDFHHQILKMREMAKESEVSHLLQFLNILSKETAVKGLDALIQ
jgi:hypothetical protein